MLLSDDREMFQDGGKALVDMTDDEFQAYQDAENEKYYAEIKEGKHDKALRAELRNELKKGNKKGYDTFEKLHKNVVDGNKTTEAAFDRVQKIMKEEQDRDIRLLNSDEQNFLRQMEIFLDDPADRKQNYEGGKMKEEFKVDPKVIRSMEESYAKMNAKEKKEYFETMKKRIKKDNDTYSDEEQSIRTQRGKQIDDYLKARDFIDNDIKVYMQDKLENVRNTAYEGGLLSDDREMFKDGGPGIEALRKEEPKVVERMGYEDGGPMEDQMMTPTETPEMMPTNSMDEQMTMAMGSPEMMSDDSMEGNYTKFIMDEALSEEEEDMLTSKLEQDEELSMLFDKIIDVAQEFAGSGPVEGPGSGVSDSIPARLSDGEFVFTAKAVEEIGEEALMSMMKDAEANADGRQQVAVGGMLDRGEEEINSNINRQQVVNEGSYVPEQDDTVKNKIRETMLDPSAQSRYVRS